MYNTIIELAKVGEKEIYYFKKLCKRLVYLN